MSKHYQAPKHTTGIICPSGNEYRANDKGIIHVKADAPLPDHAAITAAGFTLADDTEAAAEPAPKSK